MDEVPNNYMDIGHQGLYSSIIPWANEFDFGEEADLSKIFDLPQEQPVNTNSTIPSTSIESSPKHHQNSENVSESPSDGINEENPKTFMPIVMEKQCDTSNISTSDQENPKTNGVLLQQPLQNIPILEKYEREASLKSKFTIPNQGSEKMTPKFFMNHPYGLSTSTKVGEQGNPTTNGMILPRPKSNIVTLEKLKSHLMKSKSMVDQENGIFKQGIDHSSGYEILNSLDNNEIPQNTSTNGGPIRSPNRTSSRYQPYFGRQIDLNNNEGKSDSCQVSEIWKQNYNNEENLVGRSSNLVNHSNHNLQRLPAYTHKITNKFKGVASEQNFNKYTQGNVYSNQAITSRSLNNSQENEDGSPDQLQSSWEQNWNTQDMTTTNWPWGPFP